MSPQTKLPRERRALLEKLLQKSDTPRSVIPKRAPAYEAPLSFAQQRLWFFEQLMPGTAVYNMLAALPLLIEVEPALLLDVINEIVARHEAVRTTFRSLDGKPSQVIASQLTLEMPVTDLRGLSAEETEAELARLSAEHGLAPFDLSAGPLLRVRLLRLGAEHNVLLLAMHHIVTDAWSVGVFYQELTDLYSAYWAGKPSPLMPLIIQYPDFAVWQRGWLRGDVLDRQLGYWKAQLDGIVPIDLPCDHPRPANMSFRGGYVPLSVGSSLLAQLRALSALHQCTLFMTMLAAFQVFLFRHTGQEDVVVGTPVANRNHADIEKLIGFFVNSLVMRINLAGNPTFREVLVAVRDIALAAYAHQDIPFEMLVEHLRPERDFTRNPIFQVLFQLQTVGGTKRDEPTIPGGQLHNAVFDLNLNLVEFLDVLHGRLEYNATLFDQSTAEQMAARFGVLLDAIVEDPDRRIADLPVLTAAEREQLLTQWNPAPLEIPEMSTIHEWFERQAAITPRALAVVAAGSTITYAELNERADAMARKLQELGVERGDRVALRLDRSVEMIVAIIGTLKADAAYVPVDPDYPDERVRFMMEDCGARIMLTEGGASPTFNSAPRGTGDTAYIMYTSGSTGTPKGVAVPHGALVYSTWARLQYYKDPVERYLLLSPFVFDSSVAGIFWTLCSGGCLEIATRAEMADIPELAFSIERRKISHVLTVPSLWARLVDWFEVPALHLKVAIVAGEVCPRALVAYHFERMPEVPLYNEYGPTETTVWSTVYRCQESSVSAPPIGRPIPNARAYIVDHNGQPVPIGVTGELWIGGPGVAAGYWNRPELTAERFSPDPFRGGESKLYRSGDRAKYRPDGNIVFLGRMDTQVKVRGYRVELGEIEAALLAHPAIAECAVFDWKYEDDTRLAAWVVPATERVSSDELQDFLRQWLPEYMIPASISWVGELPRNSNGKLDRAALVANPQRFDAEEYVAPRTPTEQALAKLYAEVLGVPEPSIHDDFFRLGGHSLLATRLLSRVNRTFQIDLPLPVLFKASTVAELVAEVERMVVDEIAGLEEDHS
jgi:amino acid adenylation domain-containing protein